jgi:cellulose synthase/poly-beta-1,6-N-acetylglucosamine synthase-like glycosyltransferase
LLPFHAHNSKNLKEMSEVTVTVAIPAYNAARTIYDCLSSIEAQDFPRNQMQVVVGDNGSTDNTVQIIRESFPNVEVVTALERGSAYARNAAIRVAQGRYICSTDADCVADPTWVSTMVQTFESSPELVACLGGQILPYRVETLVEHYRHAWIQQRNLRERNESFCYAETPNAVFRRSIFDQVGLFDGNAGHDDSDMGLRLTAANLEVRYVPDAIVRHRNPATISDLYHHRVKYGARMVALANKYPDYFEPLNSHAAVRHLALQTIRRVVGDLTYKLAYALLSGERSHGTRFWPVLDAVVAVGNYVGVRSVVSQHCLN